ncbi:acyl-CoA dehydrogenase [Thermicanus aegyptius]|uniref:acyl-CoA dehydrogenase n=1 Tax=Thermicanus aegyptius TaxID=94009 RepID=UPI000406B496|nr:acyl-CoA dehydrogenase [Thermicanus aegyptius]
MNFSFTEEQLLLRQMVRRFAREEILPLIPRMEEEDWYPRPLLRRMGELGLMGIPLPERYGGAGLDFISYILAIHEISKVSAALGVILSVHTSVGTMPIYYFGNEAQKERFLPALAKGEAIGAFALTEPQAGSDAASIKLKAVRRGRHYCLTGTKQFITNGGEADTYVVFAVTDPERGIKGITAFIVEKGTPGFSTGRREKKMGLHGSSTATLLFEEAEVPVENRLGEEGEGYKIAMANLDVGRIGIAAQALGIGEAAFAAALAYAKGRKQFGRPIADQQAIRFKLAQMATELEGARLLVYRAASLKEEGKPAGLAASQAKLFASDVAVKVATEAVQIFGGYGYIRDYPVERYFRDAKITQIYEGTNEIQHLVIGKYLLAENNSDGVRGK